ncbi:MAG: metallophosphoesterase family protein [Janthinobacterium lividum]
MLNRFFESRRGTVAVSAIPPGHRVYAVGDIHGRLDLLDRLIALIDADDAAKEPVDTTLIFLGDVVDRGPNSAGVVHRLRELQRDRLSTRLLLGNHEEIFLAALTGEQQAVRTFCRVGGRETLISYGVTELEYERMDYNDVAAALVDLVPRADREFVRNFTDMIVLGDYAFVHAGIDPAIPLSEQQSHSLRWIRQPFLTYRGEFEKVIVHGHTIHHGVEMSRNRIGIDTGAYQTGRLSAICLEGTERHVIQT